MNILYTYRKYYLASVYCIGQHTCTNREVITFLKVAIVKKTNQPTKIIFTEKESVQ